MNKFYIFLMSLLVFSYGCGTSNLVPVESEKDFYKTVNSNKVVLMDFYKTGCPPCVILEPVLDQLMSEYDGKVTVAKYRHMNPIFMLTSQKVQDQYKVNLVPTVILFVNGKEKNRWLYETNIDAYRKALKDVGVEKNPIAISIKPPASLKQAPAISSTKDIPKKPDSECGPQGCPIEPQSAKPFEPQDKNEAYFERLPDSSDTQESKIPVATSELGDLEISLLFVASTIVGMILITKIISGFKRKRGSAASS